MPYDQFGKLHAMILRALSERGQGTVEYVGLMLLLATLLTGVVAAAKAMKDGGIAKEIVDTLRETIGSVGGQKK